MSLVVLKDDPSVVVEEKTIAEIDFDEFSRKNECLELTNVYQLRVKKAQFHLEHLKASIERKTKDLETINSIKGVVDNPFLKDNLDKFANCFIVKSSFINDGQLLSVSEVLTETCDVVALLEEDRSSVNVQICRQRQRVQEMLMKIEGLSFFRMDMLPTAVQKEHEACANDIYELQWHIKHRSKIEKKIRDKRNKAKDINDQLNEEIEEIKEYIPLVEEKLRLEIDILAKIEETKTTLTQELDASVDRVQITQSKHDNSTKKAESERLHIKRDLHNSNKILMNTQKSLQHGVKEHEKMEDFKGRFEEKIKQNHLQIAKLNSENAAKATEQKIFKELVDVLDSRMRELSFTSQRLIEDRDKKKNDLEEQEAEQQKIVGELKNKRDELDQNLTSLKRSNRQMEIEIDSIKETVETCTLETEKTRDRIQTMKTEIVEAEKTYDEGIEEFSRESRKHAVVRQRLTEKMKAIQEAEDKLRKTLTDVENQIKQEILTKASVKSKMTTDIVDLEKSKKEAIEKQKQMKAVLSEALAMVKAIRAQVAEVDAQHKKTSEELQALISENRTMLTEHERMRKEMSSRVEDLTPTHGDLRKRVTAIVQHDDHIQWQIGTMNTQLMDMSASEKLIVNAKKKMQETLLETEREYHLHAVEVEILRKHEAKLTDAMSQMQSQANRMRSTHSQYLQERETALTEAQKEFEQSLIENEKLAKQYRASQTDFYGMQDAYLDVIQEHLWGEDGVKDMKEIQRLQRHMHNCMDAFFTMKLMYDDDQYVDLQRRCSYNLDEIELLKQGYTKRIESIKVFLSETFPRESQLVCRGD